jgi:hypothetical protein
LGSILSEQSFVSIPLLSRDFLLPPESVFRFRVQIHGHNFGQMREILENREMQMKINCLVHFSKHCIIAFAERLLRHESFAIIADIIVVYVYLCYILE